MIIFQRPNVLSFVIIISLLASGLAPAGSFKTVATAVAIIAIAAWGYDELRYGVNWLRRLFGTGALLVALVALVYRLK